MASRARELSLAAFLALLLGALAVFAPGFYQPQPLLSLLARTAPVLIAAVGMALVIIARQIDISIGSQFAVVSVTAGLLAGQGTPFAWVILFAIVLGILLGAMNGALVAALGLPSIVVTLATMVAWREALRWMRQGEFVNLPEKLQWFGLNQGLGQATVIALSLTLLFLAGGFLRWLMAGRWVYAIGSNPEAARLAGLRPRTITFVVFCLMGAFAGFAAVLNLVQSPQVDPKTGSGLELQAIAAVVVGGVSISGGRGGVIGVFLGTMLLAIITPALTHLHIEAYWERALQGAIILLATLGEGKERPS